jgi:hypothetical protein
MEMKLRIAPEPIVGREVFAIIKLRSRIEAPNTKLKIDASEGIHFASAAAEFDLSLPEGQWIEVRIPFIVHEEGVNLISAHAFNRNNPESESGFGAGKTLYIRSGVIGATISETELTE